MDCVNREIQSLTVCHLSVLQIHYVTLYMGVLIYIPYLSTHLQTMYNFQFTLLVFFIYITALNIDLRVKYEREKKEDKKNKIYDRMIISSYSAKQNCNINSSLNTT